jgi:hypothetical protein
MSGFPIIVPPGDPVAPAQSTSRAPQITLSPQNVLPPNAIYLQQDDQLWIEFQSNGSVINTVAVRGRLLRPDGVIIPIEQDFQLQISRSTIAGPVPLMEGWLLSLIVFPAFLGIRWGQLYVSLSLNRGTLAQFQISQTLCAGYTTLDTPLSWPWSGIRSPLETPGDIVTVVGGVPAAGAEITETVPTFVRWRLISFKFRFVTAIAVANRVPALALDDGANVYSLSTAGAVQIASITEDYSAAPGLMATFLSGAVANLGLPMNSFLPAGHRIRTITSAIQAADQYSAIEYAVEQWLVGSL